MSSDTRNEVHVETTEIDGTTQITIKKKLISLKSATDSVDSLLEKVKKHG